MTTELAMGTIGAINLNECGTDISTYITSINNTDGYTITASYNTYNPISTYISKLDNDSKPRMFYQAETHGKQYRTIRFGRSKETSKYLMPEFSDVRIIRDKEGFSIGVGIDFTDGTKQKAICMPDDTFNLEQGITICLFKKMLTGGCYIEEQYVTGVYNKLVKLAIKIRNRRIKAEEEAKKAEEEAKLQEQRFQEKRRKAKIRQAKRKYERRINELAEAIRRSGIVPNINRIDDGK